jgi:hypothetical protein
MTKVAYNRCFGDFSLSRAAILRGREISGDPKWAGCMLKGEPFDDGSGVASDDFGHIDYKKHPRTDPILVQVIEELGRKADGMCAKLAVAKVPKGKKYRIDEYDGAELVMTPDDYEWQTA